jgi:Leucine-rich repeat (LRR) protein
MFVCFVLLSLSASQFCPEEYKCSSGNGTLPDTQSSFGDDTHMLDLSCKNKTILVSEDFSEQNVTNVTSVHLNDNCIQFVPAEAFKSLVSLRYLYLQNNQINKIHFSAFQSNVHLITLDLSGNKLQELSPIIFQKSSNLLWVNITGNPLNASALEPTLFNSSLNTIDADNCNNTQYSINAFEAIPYLRGLNLKENAVFTVENLTIFENIKAEEMNLENYVFQKLLKSGYNDSSELRYDGIQKVILGPSNTSFMCFCNRLSAWFWCFERPLMCPGHSVDIYSLLNCNVTPTETPLLHTSSSSSAPALSTEPSTKAATTDDTTDFATDTNTSNISPEQETAGDNVALYVAIGSGVFVIIIIIIIICTIVINIVVRKRRKKKVTELKVSYTSMSWDNSDPSNSVTYYDPRDRRGYNAEGHTYATPFAHNQYTTFRPVPVISARADNVRRISAQYD